MKYNRSNGSYANIYINIDYFAAGMEKNVRENNIIRKTTNKENNLSYLRLDTGFAISL